MACMAAHAFPSGLGRALPGDARMRLVLKLQSVAVLVVGGSGLGARDLSAFGDGPNPGDDGSYHDDGGQYVVVRVWFVCLGSLPSRERGSKLLQVGSAVEVCYGASFMRA